MEEESHKNKRLVVATSMDVVLGNVDLLCEILLRLPARSLVKFGLVCKLWLNIIAGMQFRLSHSRNLAFSNFIYHSGVYFYNYLTDLRQINSIPLNDNVTSLPPVPLLDQMAAEKQSSVKVTQSCNGLLMCVATSKYELFDQKLGFVYNPATNEYYPLPDPYAKYYEVVYGYYLVFDPLEPPYYKVFCVKRLGTTFQGSFLGSRDIEIIVYVPRSESWRSCCRFFRNYNVRFDCGVFCNGAIHWLGEVCSVHFDIKSEEVVIKNMPPSLQEDFAEKMRYFGELDGHLHLVQVQSRYAKKFNVLELDKDTWKWKVKYRVHLARLISTFPEMAKPALYGPQYMFSILSLIRGEKEEDPILLLTIPRKVVAYNIRCRTIKVIRELPDEISDTPCFNHVSAYQYIESLFPIRMWNSIAK